MGWWEILRTYQLDAQTTLYITPPHERMSRRGGHRYLDSGRCVSRDLPVWCSIVPSQRARGEGREEGGRENNQPVIRRAGVKCEPCQISIRSDREKVTGGGGGGGWGVERGLVGGLVGTWTREIYGAYNNPTTHPHARTRLFSPPSVAHKYTSERTISPRFPPTIRKRPAQRSYSTHTPRRIQYHTHTNSETAIPTYPILPR